MQPERRMRMLNRVLKELEKRVPQEARERLKAMAAKAVEARRKREVK